MSLVEFIRAWPSDIPCAEVCPEDDGDISLEWYGDGGTVSVSYKPETDEMAVAWITKGVSGCAKMVFNFDDWPDELCKRIKEAMP